MGRLEYVWVGFWVRIWEYVRKVELFALSDVSGVELGIVGIGC